MLKYLSWRNWALIEYNSVTENFFIFSYFGLRNGLGGSGFVVDVLLFYVFGAFSASYGYLINDFADRKLDLLHGKHNIFHGDNTLKALLVVVAFFLAANIFGLRFARYEGFLPLWMIWIGLSTFYSLPPIRLKEEGAWGLLAAVLAQRVMPAMLAITVFGDLTSVDSLVILGNAAVRGFISDVRHQIEDSPFDARTATRTYVYEVGVDQAKRMLKRLLASNLALQIFLYASAVLFLPKVSLMGTVIPLGAPVLLMFLVLCVLHVFIEQSRKTNKEFDPYVGKELGNFLNVGFESFYFPFFLMIVHSFFYPSTLLIVLFFLLLKGVFVPRIALNSYPALLIKRCCRISRLVK